MSIFNHFRHAHLSHQTLFGNQNWKIFLRSWNCCSWCCYFNIVAVVVVVGVILVVHGVVVDVVVNVVDYEIKTVVTVLGRLSLFSLSQFFFLVVKVVDVKGILSTGFYFYFQRKEILHFLQLSKTIYREKFLGTTNLRPGYQFPVYF